MNKSSDFQKKDGDFTEICVIIFYVKERKERAMEIGARLKAARSAIGYTIQKASEESGIGDSSISEFENSKREPRFSQLSKLAEVYRKSIDFFFEESLPAKGMMLWRNQPEEEEEKKETEAKFHQLCEQYRRLELCTNEVRELKLPEPPPVKPEEFSYGLASDLAMKVQREFSLGDIPSSSLKRILEEKYFVRIFHMSFNGSAISTISQEFGPAILLRKKSKLWRRNFDLAHELFHLLTWPIFRTNGSIVPSDFEEKLANAFASRLLLPTDSVKKRIDSIKDNEGNISFEDLDEIAREFGVSLEALLWRLVYLYDINSDKIEGYIAKSKKLKLSRPERLSDAPDELPERFCSLALKALRDGNLSLMKFAKYMGMSYKQAQKYQTEDEGFKDEKVSISVA